MKMYVLFTCDVWKSKSSMSLIGVTSNYNKLKRQIKKMIKSGDIEMNDSDKKFNVKDYSTANDINNNVNYCYVEETENGAFDC